MTAQPPFQYAAGPHFNAGHGRRDCDERCSPPVEPSPWPAIGEPLCWCGHPHAEPDSTTGHLPIGARRPWSHVWADDGAELHTGPVELVTAADGRQYTQRRAVITDGETCGRLVFTRFHGRPSLWRLSWADDAGWTLAGTLGKPRRWLDTVSYGPGTYGHTDYILP